MGETPALRGKQLRRARCIAKGARRVRKGALGNQPAKAGSAPSAHLTIDADGSFDLLPLRGRSNEPSDIFLTRLAERQQVTALAMHARDIAPRCEMQ